MPEGDNEFKAHRQIKSNQFKADHYYYNLTHDEILKINNLTGLMKQSLTGSCIC